MKIKTNKILQTIISEEQKRKSKIDKIRSSLTDEDFDYIDTLILVENNFNSNRIEFHTVRK